MRRVATGFEGCRVTVMGLGLFGGGAAAARYLAERGARVTVTDLRGENELAPALSELADLDLRFVLGEHRARDFITSDIVVANPAVPVRDRHLVNAKRSGARITSEIALFLDACPARVVAVTGTQGKSSTTDFLAQLLRATGHRTHLGGNIGRSLLPALASMSSEDVCAVELSSYQLEELPEHLAGDPEDSPLVGAAVLNVLADHLERHGTRAEYAHAKLRLLECLRPGGTVILPAEPLPTAVRVPEDVELLERGPGGLRIEGGEFLLGRTCLGRVAELASPAPFQRENVLVALGLAASLGAPPAELARAVPGLRGLPHRLNRVGDLGGRPLWDNGVSTTPDTTLSAVEALPPGQVVLIGGRTKELELAPLLAALAARESRVVLFGEAGRAWPGRFEEAGVPVEVAPDPPAALQQALAHDAAGILFSPACSSFDAYPNFQARAKQLLEAAKPLGLTAPAEGPGA